MAVTVRDDINPAHCRGSAEFLATHLTQIVAQAAADAP
jgi:hypothetical protein